LVIGGDPILDSGDLAIVAAHFEEAQSRRQRVPLETILRNPHLFLADRAPLAVLFP
jgi:hypothetical protein